MLMHYSQNFTEILLETSKQWKTALGSVFSIDGVKIISDTVISWSYLVFSFILLKFFGPEAKELLVLNYVWPD